MLGQLKRKKKILYGLCGFLVFMLICTFVSRVVYSDGLAFVEIWSPEAMVLNHLVSASGNVSQGKEKALIVPEGVPIQEVFIREGDRIEEGQELFALDMEGLEDFIKEQKMSIADLEQQISALTYNQEVEDDLKSKEIARAKEDYNDTAEESKKQIKRAEEDADAAREKLAAYESEKPGDFEDDAAKEAWEDSEKMLRSALAEAERNLDDVKDAREKALKNAGRVLEDAKRPQNKDNTLESIKMQLELKKDRLEKYTQLRENGGKVTAEQAGVVTRVNVVTGGMTAQTAALVYAVLDGQLLFEALLDKDQKQYVSKGDRVTIKLGNENSVEAKVDYLTETGQGDGSYEAAVMLEAGAGELGQSGIMETVFQTERFACCIPLDALHEGENQRYFVYVLAEKEGFLGTELSAKKLFVRVLDKNDSFAAIEPGILGADSKVITYSTKEIGDGTVVRMR